MASTRLRPQPSSATRLPRCACRKGANAVAQWRAGREGAPRPPVGWPSLGVRPACHKKQKKIWAQGIGDLHTSFQWWPQSSLFPSSSRVGRAWAPAVQRAFAEPAPPRPRDQGCLLDLRLRRVGLKLARQRSRDTLRTGTAGLLRTRACTQVGFRPVPHRAPGPGSARCSRSTRSRRTKLTLSGTWARRRVFICRSVRRAGVRFWPWWPPLPVPTKMHVMHVWVLRHAPGRTFLFCSFRAQSVASRGWLTRHRGHLR